MKLDDKKLTILVWVGGAGILIVTFAKLLWVVYFGSMRSSQTDSLSALVIETTPLFLLAVAIGAFVAWFRAR